MDLRKVGEVAGRGGRSGRARSGARGRLLLSHEGCAIGAGVTGSSILSGAAWLTLFFFFVGAGITNRLIDYRPQS